MARFSMPCMKVSRSDDDIAGKTTAQNQLNSMRKRSMQTPVDILVVGLGNMGLSHAKAYVDHPDFNLVATVTRSSAGPGKRATFLKDVPHETDFYEALEIHRPDAVCVATYTETHFPYTMTALEAGAHVFVEKPLASSVEDARRLVALAHKTQRKLLIGYILRHHPSWRKFVSLARTLGKPLVMRLNLNQRSDGEQWRTHKQLMRTTSPIVDCGVHYVDVMCQMTDARPVRVHAIGARLLSDMAENMVNYGQLQVSFEDGSVGWYEAGWGPMISETAFFVKDVIGPKGSISIDDTAIGESQDIDGHTKTGALILRHADLRPDGTLARQDEILDMAGEPNHQALCDLEQACFLDAIRSNLDLGEHHRDAINSLAIVLAAQESIETGKVIPLDL